MLMFETERADTVTIPIDEYTDLVKEAEMASALRSAIYDEAIAYDMNGEYDLTGMCRKALGYLKYADPIRYKEVLKMRKEEKYGTDQV